MANRLALRPCPFCGGEARLGQIQENSGMDGFYTNWYVSCQKCGATIEKPADGFYGREYIAEEAEMVKLWNTRWEDKK